MSVVKELIRSEDNGAISFGNYELDSKQKLDNFSCQGDIYKVKTFGEITKLERNGGFVYESVPGTAVFGLDVTEDGVSFSVEGPNDAQITLGVEEETEYKLTIDGNDAGNIKASLGGKITFGVELGDKAVEVKVTK